MSHGLDELYGIGLEIGREVDSSTAHVKRVTDKVVTTSARVEEQDRSVQRLIKKK